MTTKRKILRSASVVALVTVVSRICGYVRDQRVAFLLGTSPAADALVLAFRIPNLIRRMTGEGSFAASFVPVFTDYMRNEPPQRTWTFAQRVFWDMAAVLAVVTVVAVLFSRQLIASLTFLGGNHARWDLAVYLNHLIFPAVFFIGLAAVATAILHSFQVFALPAATPVFFNLALIACSFGIVYQPIVRWAPERFRSPAVALAVGILAGGVIQFAMQVPALVRRGMRFAATFSTSDPGVRKVARLMVPSFFGHGVYQINLFVDTIFAASSRMPAGSIMSLYVADRVMQLVLGSYAIAMSTALLPAMSHQMAAGKWEDVKHTFGFSLRIVSFITIPAAVGLILLRHPIIQVLFQHGQFATESTTLTSRALLYYSLGLPAFAAIKLITPMYYSTQDTWTPAWAGLCALMLNVGLNVSLMYLFGRALLNGSPALASAASAYMNFGLLFWLFRRRYGRLGMRRVTAALARMAASAAVMATVCWVAMRRLPFAMNGHLLAQAGWLAVVIAACVGVYFSLAWALRCEELGDFFLLLKRAEPAAESLAGSAV